MLVNFTFDTKEKTDDASAEHQKRLYEKYSSERDALNRTALEIGGRYDKAVFILAGGAFALSVTFIEKIAPNPTWLSIAFLAASWFFLLACLVMSLYATSKSQSAIQWQITLLDTTYQQLLFPESSAPEVSGASSPSPVPDARNPYIATIQWLDEWARASLVLGLVCLCLFAVLNVFSKETTDASKTPTLQPSATTTTAGPAPQHSDYP